MKKTRKPGGGRKKLKPEYDAGKNLKEDGKCCGAYDSEMSLQAIGDELGLNHWELLITAGVYESCEKAQDTFEEYRETQNYKEESSQPAATLNYLKLPSPRTCHIGKVCTS